MPRRGSTEDWYIKRRIGLADRLESGGLLPDAAEGWVQAWEVEARARHFDPKTEAFWDGADAWLEDQWKGED
jgi:hypothetical protein